MTWTPIAAALAVALSATLSQARGLQADDTILLALVERDLTGDGAPEVLRVVGAGPATDSLDVTLTVESEGRRVYRYELAPLGQTIGFDAGRRVLSPEEQRTRIRELGKWFFAESKFQRPEEFVESLRDAGPRLVGEIPNAIARDRQASDTVPGDEIWEEIRKAPVTIFTFSPGGDAIVAIGWNERAGRFYRLLECC